MVLAPISSLVDPMPSVRHALAGFFYPRPWFLLRNNCGSLPTDPEPNRAIPSHSVRSARHQAHVSDGGTDLPRPGGGGAPSGSLSDLIISHPETYIFGFVTAS